MAFVPERSSTVESDGYQAPATRDTGSGSAALVRAALDRAAGHRAPRAYDELTYPFTPQYQRKILATLLLDRSFLPKFGDIIRASHFTTPASRDTAALILEFWTDFKAIPTVETLEQRVREEIDRRGNRLPKAVGDEWLTLIQGLRNVDLSDREIIERQVVQWARHRVFEVTVMEVAALVDRAKKTGREDYSKARGLIQDALAFGQDSSSNVIDYFAETPNRIARLLIDETEYGMRIPLMMPKIDRIIGGGVSRGEILVWVAPTGRGKTFALLWGAKAALYQELNVAIVTCEMSKEKLARRMDRSIARMSEAAMRRNPQLAQARIREAESYRGWLKIIELMGKDATVERIYQKLEQLRVQQGFYPDVIVVDYPGEMKPSEKFDQRRFGIADIYRDLRTLGRELDVPVHTAMQTNRSSLAKRVITIQDLAECYEVAPISDLMLALCQTEDEELAGLLRVFIAKHRDGVGHYVAPFRLNKETGTFRSAGDAVFAPLTGRNGQPAALPASEDEAREAKARA